MERFQKYVYEGKDPIPSGTVRALFDQLAPKGTDYKEFAMGMKVELEHDDVTKGDPTKTAKIALAHLKEKPNYYTLLKKVER